MQLGSPPHSERQVWSQVPPDEDDELDCVAGVPSTQVPPLAWAQTTP
jgi:hypothetical protein